MLGTSAAAQRVLLFPRPSRNEGPPIRVLDRLLGNITLLGNVTRNGGALRFPGGGTSDRTAPVEVVGPSGHSSSLVVVVGVHLTVGWPSSNSLSLESYSGNASLCQCMGDISREKGALFTILCFTPSKKKKKSESSRKSSVSFYIIYCVNLEVVTFEIWQISPVP